MSKTNKDKQTNVTKTNQICLNQSQCFTHIISRNRKHTCLSAQRCNNKTEQAKHSAKHTEMLAMEHSKLVHMCNVVSIILFSVFKFHAMHSVIWNVKQCSTDHILSTWNMHVNTLFRCKSKEVTNPWFVSYKTRTAFATSCLYASLKHKSMKLLRYLKTDHKMQEKLHACTTKF